jgi:hypothetical protein
MAKPPSLNKETLPHLLYGRSGEKDTKGKVHLMNSHHHRSMRYFIPLLGYAANGKGAKT